MAWYGADHLFFMRESALICLAYWATLIVLIVITLYIVKLDIRYTYLKYAIGQRDLFRQTWEDESFRKALIEAQQKKNEADRS